MEQHNETLTHHGVKGMRWGVRKDRYQLPYMTARRAAKIAKADSVEARTVAEKAGNLPKFGSPKKGKRIEKAAYMESIKSTRNHTKYDTTQWADPNKVNTTLYGPKGAQRIQKRIDKSRLPEKYAKKYARAVEDGRVAVTKTAKSTATTATLFVATNPDLVKRGAKAVSKAMGDKMFNASIIDKTGKVILRYNM